MDSAIHRAYGVLLHPAPTGTSVFPTYFHREGDPGGKRIEDATVNGFHKVNVHSDPEVKSGYVFYLAVNVHPYALVGWSITSRRNSRSPSDRMSPFSASVTASLKNDPSTITRYSGPGPIDIYENMTSEVPEVSVANIVGIGGLNSTVPILRSQVCPVSACYALNVSWTVAGNKGLITYRWDPEMEVNAIPGGTGGGYRGGLFTGLCG